MQTTSQAREPRDFRAPSTFAALRHRNYRLWFIGQMLSLMGTWMQSVAQGWVVYQMTGSELALGTITLVGSLPTLFLMLPAGAVVDRVPKRKLLLITQTTMLIQAVAFAALSAMGRLSVWHIGVLAFGLGVANSFDAPARHALAVDMVDDRRDLMNAVALNSAMFNLARIVGPAVGGIVLAGMGASWCFALNALSFLAVLVALLFMRFPPFVATPKTEPMLAEVKVGLSYIRHNTAILIMVSLVGVSQLFGFSYSILLPAYAAEVLHVGEAGLGSLQAATGVGALIGSLIVASLGVSRRRSWLMITGSLVFPVAVLGLAFSHSTGLSLACLAVAGVGFVTQNATANTIIQYMVPDQLRGRVMAVYLLMFFGTTPFAAVFAGTVGQTFGVRSAVAAGAGITLLYTVVVLSLMPSLRHLEA